MRVTGQHAALESQPLDTRPGRRFGPRDPESEDLLALAATAARSQAASRTGPETRWVGAMSSNRSRADRCPGALRPWRADDGMLVRLRLIGGHVATSSLEALADVAGTYGDGRVHLTSRANLQLRGLPQAEDGLPAEVISALESTGLLPSRSHELIRNVMVSPQTGLAGGRADLRGSAVELDQRLLSSPRLADLPGRFLFVLDDGRGDLIDRSCDLGLVAIDHELVQLRVGSGWSEVISLDAAAARLVELAEQFVERRGTGATAAWHVAELTEPLTTSALPDMRIPPPSQPLPYGDVPGGRHQAVTEAGLDRMTIHALTSSAPGVIITPWRGVLVPEEQP